MYLSWQRAEVAVYCCGRICYWTAFDCLGQGNEILLRHTQFEFGGATEVCNNGMIIGRNLNRTFDGFTDSIFTSQLIINLPLPNATNNTLDGRTVECTFSDLDGITVIGGHTIAVTGCGK